MFQRRPLPTVAVTTRSTVLHASQEMQKNPSECFLCRSKKHATEACSTTLTIADEKKRLASAMRCYRCTATGHHANECLRKLVCETCKDRHASRMGDPDFQTRRSNKLGTKGSDATKPVKENCAPWTAVTACQLDEAVNLQTSFRCWIVRTNHTSYVGGIFDRGRQCTFIKEDLVVRLRLKVIRETRLAMSTFASDAPSRVRNCKVVEVRLRSEFDDANEHIIEAIAMPTICHDIPATDMSFRSQVVGDKLCNLALVLPNHAKVAARHAGYTFYRSLPAFYHTGTQVGLLLLF